MVDVMTAEKQRYDDFLNYDASLYKICIKISQTGRNASGKQSRWRNGYSQL